MCRKLLYFKNQLIQVHPRGSFQHYYYKEEVQHSSNHCLRLCLLDIKANFLCFSNLCYHSKVQFNKKRDFEYTPTSTIEINRLELVQEVKKMKVKVDDSQAIESDTFDSDAIHPTPVTSIVTTTQRLVTTPPLPVHSISLFTQPLGPTTFGPHPSITLGI